VPVGCSPVPFRVPAGVAEFVVWGGGLAHSVFRAGFSINIGPPAGLRPAGGPILK
jgi:hypothetical protein